MYRAVPCGCNCLSCKHWHISPVAQVRGVGFTKAQAEAVAEFLNNRAKKAEED